VTPEQKDTARRWVEELRSGKWQQARGALRVADSMCCVGVLCNVIDPSGWRFNRGWRSWNGNLLPDAAAIAIGLPYGVALRKYSDLNDIHSASFEYIADQIEKDFQL
jgi:hypothetical protein